MEVAPIPANEAQRLAALHALDILDTHAEEGFDDLVQIATQHFNVPIALVSLIDSERQWFKAKCGIDACESSRDDAFCSHAILGEDILEVPDARLDPRFHDNPFVTDPPHIRFYAGCPLITPAGYALGTLCLINDQPGQLTNDQRNTLRSLARQVVAQIELRDALRRTNTAQDELETYKNQLERLVHERTDEIAQTREEVVHCLARAAEFRDDDTGKHVQRVAAYVKIIAEQLGLEPDFCHAISLASTLHDVGKIGIPDAILLKPGKLTDDEFAEMRCHTGRGSSIISKLESIRTADAVTDHCTIGQRIIGTSRYNVLQLAASIADTHHEKFDGSGYPRGLAGQDIPLEGRITAVADVFDALSSARPYKPAFPLDHCVNILRESAGSHFDPDLIDAFIARMPDVVRVREDLLDHPQAA
ncbi:MAG: HD domain-containing phosphohydrolase [Planctomycetota bacterium]